MELKRKDKQPVPIALYQIMDNGCIHKGIITIALVKNSSNIKLDIGKYVEHRWIGKEEIESFSEEAVTDFKDTLKKVFAHFDKDS